MEHNNKEKAVQNVQLFYCNSQGVRSIIVIILEWVYNNNFNNGRTKFLYENKQIF